MLLYVGITESLGDRTNSGHARSSDWVQFASRAEAEWHDSRELASAAERAAVREERPVYNRQYAEWDVDRQIAAYLHRREVEELESLLDQYEHAVKQFLEWMLPADVAVATADTEDNYRWAGDRIDRRFPALVLLALGRTYRDRTIDLHDDATMDAYQAVLDVVGERLAAVRARRERAEEPPF
ncbi:hypothetical protein [Dactylosporangium roseum]|uniref:hypothetical protein n=1 Tax=Dactylosporangium roseum TaxID=47989 RepID=UPI0031E31448